MRFRPGGGTTVQSYLKMFVISSKEKYPMNSGQDEMVFARPSVAVAPLDSDRTRVDGATFRNSVRGMLWVERLASRGSHAPGYLTGPIARAGLPGPNLGGPYHAPKPSAPNAPGTTIPSLFRSTRGSER